MAGIVWLASYMKSGNTWARTLLANYLGGGNEPVDVNALGTLMPVGYSRMWFDTYCGLKLSALRDDVITRLRPEVYRTMAAAGAERLFLKVHDDWHSTDRGVPLFPQDCTAGALYFVRNVLDVAASLANHGGTDIATAVDYLCRSHQITARSEKRSHQTMPQRIGSWSEHVASWLDESKLNCLVVRYEDLKADTVSALRTMVQFSGLDIDETRLARAAAYSRFDVLKAQEHERGFAEKSVSASGNFFRAGRVGGWRAELTQDQVRRLVDAHGDVMTRFGYLDARGEPV